MTRPTVSRSMVGTLIGFVVVATILLAGGRRDYPSLHTMLDATAAVLSGVLTLFFWEVGRRTTPLSIWFALGFGVTSVVEGVHALVSVEWSGALSAIVAAENTLRPATWPLAAYVLPIAIGSAVWLLRHTQWAASGFALALLGLSAALFPLFLELPRYTSPTWFGITRPTLAVVPFLWVGVGSVCWRSQSADRVLPTMALVAAVLCLGHGSMLYSRAPSDTQAVVAHLGKVTGYLTLLFSLTQMASVDLAERVRAERGLAQLNQDLELRVLERTEELRRSNEDLERFAYVASHDLQEPLRMVGSYLELLKKRYRGKLDADADDFIGFAQDGAVRMQRLIEDLLAYSRVNTRGAGLASTDANVALGRALANLKLATDEASATITHDPLPVLPADQSQLEHVFQNLIGNALKFRGAKPPAIHVTAVQRDGECVFSVRDNGIGIESQYFDRIFVIFQRLHGREEYPGTGIGLAITKRIIERHGGRIWVEAQPGQGSTFFFTLPGIEGSA